MSDPRTLLQEFFSVWDSMERMLGDIQTGDNLSMSINRDRSFQESFSRLTGSPGVVMGGVRASEPDESIALQVIFSPHSHRTFS